MDLNLVTVVVGAATALGTISMAISTYAHIRQERRQHGEIVQEGRRQHMDQFRPICVLVPPRPASILWKKRAELVEKIDRVQDNPSAPYFAGTYAIRCPLRNLGNGPLNLRVTFKFADGQTTEPWELPPLGAKAIYGGQNEPLHISIPLDDPQHGIKHALNRTDFEKVTTAAWEIWLQYEDIFGNSFCTVHHKTPLKPWVTLRDDKCRSLFNKFSQTA